MDDQGDLLENCDTIFIRGFGDTMTDREITDLFIEQGCNLTDMANVVVSTTDNTNCRTVSGVTTDVVRDIWSRIDKKPIGYNNKRVHVSTLVTVTPEKQAPMGDP